MTTEATMTVERAKELLRSMYDYNNDKCAIYKASNLDKAIKALLDAPLLNKEPDTESLECFTACVDTGFAYNRLYKHLTTPPKPATKKIKVWRVEWYISHTAFCEARASLAGAEVLATYLSKCASIKCINIIEGEQEVPT